MATITYVEANEQKSDTRSEGEKGWWQKLWTDPIASFTAVLAIFTVILAFATVRAANAAKEAAIALPILERAFVFVNFVHTDLPEFPNERSPTIPLYFGISLRNDGRTPAFIEAVHLKFDISSDVPSEIRRPRVIVPTEKREVIIPASGQDTNQNQNPRTIERRPIECSPELISEWADMTKKAYIHGWYSYFDIFGRRHFGVFCYEYLNVTNVPLHSRFISVGGQKRNHYESERTKKWWHRTSPSLI